MSNERLIGVEVAKRASSVLRRGDVLLVEAFAEEMEAVAHASYIARGKRYEQALRWSGGIGLELRSIAQSKDPVERLVIRTRNHVSLHGREVGNVPIGTC